MNSKLFLAGVLVSVTFPFWVYSYALDKVRERTKETEEVYGKAIVSLQSFALKQQDTMVIMADAQVDTMKIVVSLSKKVEELEEKTRSGMSFGDETMVWPPEGFDFNPLLPGEPPPLPTPEVEYLTQEEIDWINSLVNEVQDSDRAITPEEFSKLLELSKKRQPEQEEKFDDELEPKNLKELN